MGFFSEELKIMDQNMVKYMIEEMQNEIDNLQNEKEEQSAQIESLMKELAAYKSGQV